MSTYTCDDADDGLCPDCECCDLTWSDCEHCGGEGIDGHDCGEDTCCCMWPDDNVTCDICGGHGGWQVCGGGCDKGVHRKEAAP